ncbi:helix-turn-helix domain-containing protein [Salinispora mooreana]|uniref:helix-turn-helix domain-containing protein n=1 Tax=Salinispora mooreana TaxID=999545 RepID=UPI00036473D6|nr:helix-turn-helix transcriptional regulator [Salinispora mooreana]
MHNHRLRDAIFKQGMTAYAIAEKLEVDPKTVERWITQGRNPYPRYRNAIAALLGESETYLWPEAASLHQKNQVAQSEVVHIYPRRGAVPADLWQRLLDKANHQIGVLVYAGLFLPEQNPQWVSTLISKASEGAQVQILLGNPEGRHVAERGADERIGSAMASKVYNVLAFYEELRGHENVDINYHDTTLYNSIYRFDDEMLVNTHLFGTPAAYAPVLHLRRLSGGDIFDNYVASFNQVLAKSDAIWPED